eukprot:COSAG02_NODE_21670_length_779_cov_1.176471_1_plen_85_part_01
MARLKRFSSRSKEHPRAAVGDAKLAGLDNAQNATRSARLAATRHRCLTWRSTRMVWVIIWVTHAFPFSGSKHCSSCGLRRKGVSS